MNDSKSLALYNIRTLIEYAGGSWYLENWEESTKFTKIIKRLTELVKWPGMVSHFTEFEHWSDELAEEFKDFRDTCEKAHEDDERDTNPKRAAIDEIGELLHAAEWSNHLNTSAECNAFNAVACFLCDLVRDPGNLGTSKNFKNVTAPIIEELRNYWNAAHDRTTLASSILSRLDQIEDIKNPTERAKELSDLIDSIDSKTVGDGFDELANDIDELGPEISETTKVVEHIRNLKPKN